jgi:hypothetical protein
MKHDVNKLPKWAQFKLSLRDREIAKLKKAILEVEHADAVLVGRDWFTLHGPVFESGETYRSLFLLDRNHPVRVCQLGVGDVLLVGRAKNF